MAVVNTKPESTQAAPTASCSVACPGPVRSENGHEGGGEVQGPAGTFGFEVFEHELRPPAGRDGRVLIEPDSGDLASEHHGARVQVDVGPGQPEGFTSSQSQSERQGVERFEAVAGRGVEEPLRFGDGEGSAFRLPDSGGVGERRHVPDNERFPFRLAERRP